MSAPKRLLKVHLLACLLVLVAWLPSALAGEKPVNVLFLAVDDLRPEIGSLVSSRPDPTPRPGP